MKEWVKWLALGILSIVFGVVVLGNTVVASMAVTTITGAMLLLSGIFQIIGGLSAEGMGSKVLSLAMGVLMAFLGLSFLFNPLEGAISLALLIMILLMASGIVRIVFSMQMRGTPFFMPMLVSGALSLVLAAYIWMNFETASVSILGVLLGVELLFNGAGLVLLAFFIRTVGQALKR
ncbi:MAG: uncharacterized membrane protein HdeD (DUF308 family) [Paracoccaceae bacterium]|jgi:uncharacterized membrane protein HdeD (DUF308 family)